MSEKIESIIINQWTEQEEKAAQSIPSSAKRTREIALKVNEIIDVINKLSENASN